MTEVSSTFTAVGVSATLAVAAKDETISFTYSGTYVQSVQVERAMSPDESAWEVILGPYNTDNATVAAEYVTRSRNERIRVRCTSDTSGTGTYSISDGDKEVSAITDEEGNPLITHTQAQTTLHKQVVNSAGTVGPAPVDATDATLAVTAALHAGRTVTLNRAAGVVCTLPVATGTGNKYRFVVGTAITSNGGIVKVGDATDTFVGICSGADDDVEGATGYQWNSETGDDTFTMDGTATGGLIGDCFECEDIGTNQWAVNGRITQSGAFEATPFSATVA